MTVSSVVSRIWHYNPRCHSGGVRPLNNPKDDEESWVAKENPLATTPRSIRFAQDDNWRGVSHTAIRLCRSGNGSLRCQVNCETLD